MHSSRCGTSNSRCSRCSTQLQQVHKNKYHTYVGVGYHLQRPTMRRVRFLCFRVVTQTRGHMETHSRLSLPSPPLHDTHLMRFQRENGSALSFLVDSRRNAPTAVSVFREIKIPSRRIEPVTCTLVLQYSTFATRPPGQPAPASIAQLQSKYICPENVQQVQQAQQAAVGASAVYKSLKGNLSCEIKIFLETRVCKPGLYLPGKAFWYLSVVFWCKYYM